MILNTYLYFNGKAEEAFRFYESVFGTKLTPIVRYKDMPMGGVNIPKKDENKVAHLGLPVGVGQMLMGTDALECFGKKLMVGNNVQISIHPDSKEEADRLFSALSAGGEVEVPIGDAPWGDYYGDCVDKFAVHWLINYHEEKK